MKSIFRVLALVSCISHVIYMIAWCYIGDTEKAIHRADMAVVFGLLYYVIKMLEDDRRVN